MERSGPTYLMANCREAFGADAARLLESVHQIEQALTHAPRDTFVIAKGLLDTVCKTVLADLGEPAETDWSTPKLCKVTLSKLTLVSPTYAKQKEAEQSIRMMTGGMNGMIQGLCELRNHHDATAHGTDAHSESLDRTQAVLVAQTVDVLVAYIHRTHREAISRKPGDRIHYDDHEDFNSEFDGEAPLVEVNSVEFRPSQVMHALAIDMYRAELTAYLERLEEFASDSEEGREDDQQPD